MAKLDTTSTRGRPLLRRRKGRAKCGIPRCHIGDLDVIFGRGKGSYDHPGNVRMLEITEAAKERYQHSSNKEKKAIIMECLDKIQLPMGNRKGKKIRFMALVPHEHDLYIEASSKQVYEKMAHTLREKRDARRPPSISVLSQNPPSQKLSGSLVVDASSIVVPSTTLSSGTKKGGIMMDECSVVSHDDTSSSSSHDSQETVDQWELTSSVQDASRILDMIGRGQQSAAGGWGRGASCCSPRQGTTTNRIACEDLSFAAYQSWCSHSQQQGGLAFVDELVQHDATTLQEETTRRRSNKAESSVPGGWQQVGSEEWSICLMNYPFLPL